MKKDEFNIGAVLGLMTPVLIYYGAVLAAELLCSLGWVLFNIGSYMGADGALDYDAMTEVFYGIYTERALVMQTAGALLTIVILTILFRRDIPKRGFYFDTSSVRLPHYFLLIPAGIAASVAGTMMVNVGTWAQTSEAYQEAAEILYSGPMLLQVIALGVIFPVTEELIYRGLIYMRMRRFMNINMAIGFSALIFAAMHANIVQGIYAFILGIALAFVYEKYGSLKACMTLHISANMASLAIEAFADFFDGFTSAHFAAAAAAFGLLTLLSLVIIDRSVSCDCRKMS